jgi:hypothetical protein
MGMAWRTEVARAADLTAVVAACTMDAPEGSPVSVAVSSNCFHPARPRGTPSSRARSAPSGVATGFLLGCRAGEVARCNGGGLPEQAAELGTVQDPQPDA